MGTKQSPGIARARLASEDPRRLVGSNVSTLFSRFAAPDNIQEFLRWRDDPLTSLFIGAIRELGLTPEVASMDSTDHSVAYGLSQGCALCASLMDDPTSIYPGLFQVPTSGLPNTDDLVVDYSGQTDGPEDVDAENTNSGE